jgi:3-oxoadipate enol-lactonase
MILNHEVDKEGATPPIVLLHSLALDRSMWQPLVDELGDDYKVISLDLRGHGASTTDGSFSIEDMADDVAETLEELGHDRATIVGLSMGGCVAQALAIRHPGLVGALGLLDTTAWYGPDAPRKWAERASTARQQGMRSLSQFQLDRWFSSDFIRDNPERTDHLLNIFAANDIDSYAAACQAMGNFDARAALNEISIPTVVIVGELDPATTPEHAIDIAARIPGSILQVLPGAKHLTPVEHPAEVANRLRSLWSDETDSSDD